jgi:triosephosphate isomerase
VGRRPLIVGNWKLHKTVTESVALARAIGQTAIRVDCDVVVAPVFTSLRSVSECLMSTHVRVAAQDVHWEDQGAYTGEVSAPLLKDVGCAYCIVGHSERRHGFGESDEVIAKKIVALHRHHLIPIACVGETLEQRESGKTLDVVTRQVEAAIESVAESRFASFVIAYEPVWAIGTGRTARSIDAEEVHAEIRKLVRLRKGEPCAQQVRVLYGGSVKPENAGELLSQPNIDGALVGGASLDPTSFVTIINAAKTAANKG